ncbi:restriction endonuclease subunit S [Anoxybacillus flavithermus]|uniref:restriction endonuclease subunit S n=1 Tax=Anoxybacillus flavithermus TaxID=33934 RepID=UPI0018664215|nr:restriction endonuclease subunit S [Anoxybacillus flavithermus]MBE2941258.1 hypothetical protein [Anoxybacillus flavithermus]MBE2942286.1 hypothetical protein [Anoxybacillus flavithermus]MBE2950378.1 hypothetical protein [Anoxybacillus flavithermus]MBE2953182.1 hypothetical protein [Anoxybacillus flavithermus]MBE2958391.1 hypothetical protein [Anoxybacillus flavithermus]
MDCNTWKEIRLDEIGKIVTGKTPPTKNSENFGDRYPFVTPKDMNDDKFIKKTERYLSEAGLSLLSNQVLNGISICVSCIGSDMGKVVMVDGVCVTNQQINSITNIKEDYDPHFIYYSLKTMKEYFHKIAGGSTMPIVNKSKFSEIKIRVPELKEQKAIANMLNILDEKIELNKEMNKTLEEMAQTIFKRWFVDFEFPNENGEPYKSSGGKFVESEQGMIPEGWKAGTLDNLVVINTTSVDPKENPEILYEHYSIPAFDEQKYPKFEYGSEIKSNKYLVRPNSFLVSKLNPTTKRVWDPLCITENAISSTEFINYLPKDISYQSYLYCMLNSERFSEHLIKHATGSTGSRQRVKPAETLTFNVILPDTETLKKFDNLIRPIREKLKINQINSAVLKDVRDILLPKLMSGEIRVPDAEREVEECLQKSN